jgi:hypothetical protein
MFGIGTWGYLGITSNLTLFKNECATQSICKIN